MLKIKIITVGKIKEKALGILVSEYEKRLKGYSKTELTEVKDRPVSDNPSKADILSVLSAEGKDIALKIPKRAYVIALCIEGEELDSQQFSQMLEKVSLISSELCFIIGSSHGLSEEIKVLADFKLSLSKMTIPHNLALLYLTEQLYRGFKILRGESYHK